MEAIKVTAEKAAIIEKETRGQSSNPRWKEERKYRLTGSTLGDICRAGADKDMGLLANKILHPPNLKGIPPIEHGRTYEQTAIEAFSALTLKEVTECGIFIHPRSVYLLNRYYYNP